MWQRSATRKLSHIARITTGSATPQALTRFLDISSSANANSITSDHRGQIATKKIVRRESGNRDTTSELHGKVLKSLTRRRKEKEVTAASSKCT